MLGDPGLTRVAIANSIGIDISTFYKWLSPVTRRLSRDPHGSPALRPDAGKCSSGQWRWLAGGPESGLGVIDPAPAESEEHRRLDG